MDLASRIRQYGLNIVYDSPNALVDIVFVHGLNGHPHRTWTSAKTGTFWPVDLLPDVLSQNRVRILSYGYNANVTSFTDGASKDRILNHSETLAASLAANRTIKNCTERPIIFVCHSLGGLVVKRALIYSRSVTNEKVEHLRSIYVSTYGILFLGTPHNGSEMAKWGLLLSNICSAVLPRKFIETSPQLVKALKTNNETLQNINSLFTDMMPRFHIYFFHETLSTDVKGSRELIVDESSAAPYADGVERMGIESDHSHMCKFEDETAPGYEAVAVALLRYSRDAPGVVQERWNEEERTRMIMRTQKAREIFGDVSPPSVSDHRPAERPLGNQSEESSDKPPVQPYLPPPEKPSPQPSMESSTELSLSRSIQRGPLWVVPPGFHRNAAFFGMDKELEIIHTRLFKAKKRTENLMAVLIAGVPGSGKSHLARQYVWAHREDYPGGIFWVDAKSRQSTFKCFWDIAQAATLTAGQEFESPDTKSASKYIEAVRHWLQSRQEWLLVFDGVSFNHDEDISDFRQFLPFRERCGIIYTSVDKTLRKKQRLYEPYCLLLSPLQVEDACKLLFKDLGIKRPSKGQTRKATEVVTHYECLPLAIHAISHRLSATDKPIEKYHINSHFTDEKLAEPFLSIMHDLYRGEHFEALNLINLLSFLGHHVPVGLITLGKSFLEAWNIEVFTSSRQGEAGDLDNTLGVLIRYGLIERTSDKYPLLQTPSSPLSERNTVDPKAVIPDLSESQTESSQEGFFTQFQSSGVSDVVKIHSVVQGFCRDELKIMDKELRAKAGSRGGQSTGYYDSWLVVATHVFCTSFENAKCRMDRVDDRGSVKDYREYETHASQLVKNFPKKTAYGIVNDALKQLRDAQRTIRIEIDRISPSSSQESIRKHRSVFDRSSSSSSFPDSTASDGPSRQLTLDFSDVVPVRSESPQDARVSPQQVTLGPIIPHIFRNSSRETDDFLNDERLRDGYLTDDESTRARSPALSQMSQSTERPKTSQPPSPPQKSDEEGWHVVENPSKTKTAAGPKQTKPGQKQRRRPQFPSRIANSKPAAPVLEKTPAQWRSVSGALSEISPHRTASEALSAVSNKASPTQSSESNVSRSLPVQVKKENAPTYAYVASKMAKEPTPSKTNRARSSENRKKGPVFSMLQSRASDESLSSNVAYSTLSTDFKQDPMSYSTYSEPDHGFLQQLNALDLGSKYTGHQHGARRVAPADLSLSTPSLGPPYESNVDIKFSRRRFQEASTPGFGTKSSTNHGPIPHPSAIMPGASPPSSDPAPEFMSRNPSGQSHYSWSTEPSSIRYPLRISPLPSDVHSAPGPGPGNQHQYLPQPPQALAGPGNWALDATKRPYPPPVDASYAAVAQRQYNPDALANPDSIWGSNDKQMLPPPAPIPVQPPPSLHFGAHRVDLQAAQLRSSPRSQTRQYHQLPSQTVAPHPGYHVYSQENRSGPLFPLPTHDPASGPYGQEFLVGEPGRARARSGSTPSYLYPPGLGLDL